jgi:RNA polymerase sigma-70 factor (ECF subfamily)
VTQACYEIGPDDIAELRAYLRGGLRRAIGGLSDDDLDDFAHDAIVRVLRDLQRFRGDSKLTTWAMAVAIRVAFAALRRRRHRALRVEIDSERVDAAASESGDPTRGAEHRDLIGVLRRAIDETLTERQRAAILGELAGTPVGVLAQQLGIARNAFYKLHHDARKKLKAALIEAGFTERDVRAELRAD